MREKKVGVGQRKGGREDGLRRRGIAGEREGGREGGRRKGGREGWREENGREGGREGGKEIREAHTHAQRQARVDSVSAASPKLFSSRTFRWLLHHLHGRLKHKPEVREQSAYRH